jgi:hypothetical protein
MLLCTNCAHSNLEGALYCESCGQSLLTEDGSPLSTRQLDTSSNEVVARATWGTARFGEDATVILRIRDVAEPILLQPAKQTLLGRVDATSTRIPDLDLTAYGALEKGVSRIHAAITRSEDTLTLIDAGSANGTYLNGQRLIPDQPRLLRDGDEIRLGRLVVHIYFR